MPKLSCTHCNKPIVAFGKSRKNGTKTEDWSTRKLHKKCWKELKELKELSWYYKSYNSELSTLELNRSE